MGVPEARPGFSPDCRCVSTGLACRSGLVPEAVSCGGAPAPLEGGVGREGLAKTAGWGVVHSAEEVADPVEDFGLVR